MRRSAVLSLTAAISLCAGAAFAGEVSSDEIIAVAENYLSAYSTFKVANMEPFMGEEMVFTDPTSINQDASGGAFSYRGKAAVMKGLGDYAAQYKEFYLDYDVTRRYESNGVVVFIGDLTYTLVNKDDQTFTGGAPIVTAITVKDGKVVGHLDLYDYQGNTVDY